MARSVRSKDAEKGSRQGSRQGAKQGAKRLLRRGPKRTGPGRRGGTGRRVPATRQPAREPTLLRAPTFVRALVLMVAFVAMVTFAVVLAKLTLQPSAASVSLTHTNLRPGSSIRAYLDQPQFRDTVKQIGGNILLGVPFGVLLPAVWPRARGLVRVTIVTASVMMLVELVQGALVEGRAFDIDDVILNTLGAMLGYLPAGRRLGRALHPRRVHWWHRLGLAPRPDTAPRQANTAKPR
jgi:VanZ family protein